MKTEHLKEKEGFTLIEVLLAVFISLVLLTSVYFAVTAAQRSTTGVDIKVAAQQDVRAILDVMALEIGMASFNPKYSLTVWNEPGSLSEWRGIREVPNPAPPPTNLSMAYGLTVLMDLAGTGNNGNLARLTYVYDAGNQRINRDNGDGSGPQPFLGDAPGNPRSVRVVNDVNGNGVIDAGDLPVFRYFDTTGTEIPLANLPARIAEIRRIEITLAVDTEDRDPNTRQSRRMIYTTSVVPRNHGLF